MLMFILASIYYILKRPRSKLSLHPADKILFKLNKKIKPDKKIGPYPTLASLRQAFAAHPQQSQVNEFLKLYEKYRYGGIDYSDQLKLILKEIRKAR